MRIGILAPMVSELRPVAKAGGLTKGEVDGLAVHRGTVGPNEVVATLAGIGTTRSAAAAERLIEKVRPDHVVVSGIAGGLGTSKIGDLFSPAQVLNHDTGEASTATTLGPLPLADSIITSGVLITDMGILEGFVGDGFVAIDMETAAIATVCDRHAVPWTAFRAISDIGGDGADDDMLGLVDDDGNPRAAKSALYVLTHPQRIPALAKMARGATLAASRAATAAITACHAPA